jgi:SAM-dependent methyltransferase
MELKKYTNANREAWNQAVVIHRKGRKIDLVEEFRKPGYSTLDEVITGKLNDIGLTDKSVCQICCNNGRELLSLLNLGANDGVGFDISDQAIAEANELREASRLNCQFVRSDAYDINEEYANRFDLVYISIGALCWLPDLERLFAIVAGMLKPAGKLVIYEKHPITDTIAIPSEEAFDPADQLKVVYDYFRTEPLVSDHGFDYVGKTTYQGKTNYDFMQTIGYIITSIARNNLVIEEMTEFRHDISEIFEHLGNDSKLPLSYILIAHK